MIVKGQYKKYVGAIRSAEAAARIYDKYALIMQGFEVSAILFRPPNTFAFFVSSFEVQKLVNNLTKFSNLNSLNLLLIIFLLIT